ncbi:MAG: hypothetical protein ACYC7F_02380 [Gemmatimonadaceae bacterium]
MPTPQAHQDGKNPHEKKPDPQPEHGKDQHHPKPHPVPPHTPSTAS